MKVEERKESIFQKIDNLIHNKTAFSFTLMIIAGPVLMQASYYFPEPNLPFNGIIFIVGFSSLVVGILGMSVVLKKYDPTEYGGYHYISLASNTVNPHLSDEISDSEATGRLGSKIMNILFVIFGPVLILFGDIILSTGPLTFLLGAVMMIAGLMFTIYGMLALVSKYMLGTL